MIRENQKLLNIMHIIIDAIIIAFSFLLAYQLRFDDTWSPLIKYNIIRPPFGYYKSLEEYRNMLIMLIPCYIIIYYICGMYDPKRTSGRRSELFSLIKASILGMLYTVAILYFLLRENNYARLFLGIFVVLNISIDYMFRLFVIKMLRKMRRAGKNLKHILIVGYSRTAKGYIDRLRSHPDWGYSIHGLLDDNQPEGETYRHVQIIGKIDRLPELLSSNEYDEIAITLGIDEYSKLEKIVAICEKSGVHTKFIPDYNNIIPTKPYTEDLDGIPVIHVRHVPLSSSFNKVLKRCVDISGALVAIIVFCIPMLASAIIIKITSPGPLIFKQKSKNRGHSADYKSFVSGAEGAFGQTAGFIPAGRKKIYGITGGDYFNGQQQAGICCSGGRHGDRLCVLHTAAGWGRKSAGQENAVY